MIMLAFSARQTASPIAAALKAASAIGDFFAIS
jgi:hypothetical protein